MPTTSRYVRRVGALAAAVALSLALTSCVSDGSTTIASDVAPAPGRTIEATPGAMTDLAGYRIAVVVPDDSAGSDTLLAAVRRFAESSGADLQEFIAPVSSDDPVGEALVEAIDSGADVVVGLGEGVVGVFDFETGKILDQQVLVIGGQLAEPTENVTAVIWPGATAREPSDDESVTIERGVDALAAGVTSIRAGETGVVLSLP